MVICKSLSWTCEFAGFPTYILVLVLAPVQDLTLLLVIISCFPFFLITSCWGQDAPPLFLSSWLLKIADPLPPVLVWVSFLSGCYALQWVLAVGEGCLCAAALYRSVTAGIWCLPSLRCCCFPFPSALPRGESMRLQKYPGSSQTFAYDFRIHQWLLLATAVVTANCLRKIFVVSFHSAFMNESSDRKNSCSFCFFLFGQSYFISTSWLFALFGGDNSTRLVLLRFS